MYWKLDENHKPIPCGRRDFVLQFDGDKWPERIVKQEVINSAQVSTVFLPCPSFDGQFFETMIFDHPLYDCWQQRYNTWDEAVAGHNVAVALVLANPITNHPNSTIPEGSHGSDDPFNPVPGP